MNNILKFFIWLLFVMATITCGFDLINLPSAIANCIGFVLILAVLYISVKTICFTTIKLTKNKKENDSI